MDHSHILHKRKPCLIGMGSQISAVLWWINVTCTCQMKLNFSLKQDSCVISVEINCVHSTQVFSVFHLLGTWRKWNTKEQVLYEYYKRCDWLLPLTCQSADTRLTSQKHCWQHNIVQHGAQFWKYYQIILAWQLKESKKVSRSQQSSYTCIAVWVLLLLLNLS